MSLTSHGLDVVERAVETHVAGLTRLAEALSSDEQAHLQALLSRLLVALAAQPAR